MTIIVSAIRLSGSGLLKSIVGRARDSPDDEERELLPSTSSTVREIWNGQRVVRQTGESKTVELLHDRDLDLSRGSLSLVSVKKKEYTSAKPSHDSEQSLAETQVARRAPSLTLNIDGALPTKVEVIYFMCWGIAIQVSILVVNALVVYRWRWLRAGSAITTYGYPVWAAGTISISLGVFVCGQLVESRATTKEVQAKSADKDRYILRLQSKLPNLNLPAYALFQDRANLPIKISRLDENLADELGLFTKRKIYTVFGTLLTLLGFICQNIGTRELHWSAGVLQLGATLLVTVIRAGVRRDVGRLPQPPPLRLCDGTAASCLALLLEEGRENPPQAPVSFKTKLRSFYLSLIPPECRSIGTQLDMEKHLRDPKTIKESCHVLIERTCVTDTSLVSLDGDERLARLRPSLIDFTVTPQNLANDCQRKLCRILDMHAVLTEFEQDKEAIANIASSLCSAMRAILLAVNCDGLRWRSHMVLAKSCEEPGFGQCVPIEFFSTRTGRSIYSDGTRKLAEETPKKMQAMISLTNHQFIHPRTSSEKLPPMSKKTMRIFGQCQDDDECDWRDRLIPWFGMSAEVGKGWEFRTWNRVEGIQWGYKGDPSIEGKFKGNYTTFGSQFRNVYGSDDPSSEIDILGISDEETSLITNLAIDIFSSFMLRLGKKEEVKLREYFYGENVSPRDRVENLVNILIHEKVCSTRLEARAAIVPALVAYKIF